VVLLVILAAVAVRSITGEEGIIGASGDAADNYKIAEYKEQVEFTVRNTILAKAGKGQDVKFSDIAKGLDNETTWVKEAHANTDSSINNEDVINGIIDVVPKDDPNYDEVIKVLNYYKENKDKVIELINGLEELKTAEEKYNEGMKLYNDAEAEYQSGYNTYVSYYNEYQNGLSLYNNGLREYNSNLNLYNSKIAEYYESKNMFELKIVEAKKALDEIPKCTWYTYSRIDDSGYSSFIDDGESVSNLSKVFPTIFFVVARVVAYQME